MTQKTVGLTETDKQAIAELRRRLSNELKEVPSNSDDYSLLRWLIGWDYKIDLIVPKLKHTLTTLAALKLHQADFSSIEKVTEYVNATCTAMSYYPGGIMGYDKEGNVVAMQPMAKTDPKSLLPTGRLSDMLINRIAESEGIMSLVRCVFFFAYYSLHYWNIHIATVFFLKSL
uniref:Uncharacterized protein n=1 Tax=Plectus sambesii TaxID=2011161 RepID=A0A914XN50_9BILA